MKLIERVISGLGCDARVSLFGSTVIRVSGKRRTKGDSRIDAGVRVDDNFCCILLCVSIIFEH